MGKISLNFPEKDEWANLLKKPSDYAKNVCLRQRNLTGMISIYFLSAKSVACRTIFNINFFSRTLYKATIRYHCNVDSKWS